MDHTRSNLENYIGSGDLREYLSRIAILLVPFIVALGLRLHGLADESLFMDEIRQTSYYELDHTAIVRAAATQNQPPLDYWIGRMVSLISSSDMAVRLPAALFGAGSVLLLTLMVASFASLRVAVLAGLVLALLPFHIYYSQEARPYALPVFLLLALLYQVHHMTQPAAPRVPAYFLLGLVATLFAFSRADFPMIILASLIGVGVVGALLARVYTSRAMAGRLAAMTAALAGALLLYLPLFLYLIDRGARYAPGTTKSVLDWVATGLQRFTFVDVWQAWWAQTEPLGYALIPMAVVGGIIVLLSGRMRQSNLPRLVVLLLLLAVPAHLLSFYASTQLPLRPPYLIYLLPLSVMLAAVPLNLALQRLDSRRANLAVLGVIAVLIAPLYASVAEFKSTPKRTDWRGLAGYLQRTTNSTNVLFADSLVEPGAWEPDLYGINRYRPGSAAYGGSLRGLSRQLDDVSVSTLSPVLVLFQHRPYLLTPSSDYPLMNSSKTQPIPLAEILSDSSLEIATFTGLTAIRREKSSGSLAGDLKVILGVLTEKLPNTPSTVDLVLARAVAERACGLSTYLDTLEQARNLVGSKRIEGFEETRRTLQSHAPGVDSPDCKTGRGIEKQAG